jgi:selenocysteine-specific translation elongation factor
MTIPPMGSFGTELWMMVDDVFHIKGRGTVVTGELQGNGELNSGDTLVCDGQRWQVGGIEQFGRTVRSALAGSSIGVLLANDPAAGALRGKVVQFEPDAPARPGSPVTSFAPAKKRRWRG